MIVRLRRVVLRTSGIILVLLAPPPSTFLLPLRL